MHSTISRRTVGEEHTASRRHFTWWDLAEMRSRMDPCRFLSFSPATVLLKSEVNGGRVAHVSATLPLRGASDDS